MTLELPEHINNVPQNRQAIAPYNFVELPEVVVPAEELPRHDLYENGRYTGQITCSLTTSSPLYVRCGLTPEEVKRGLEAKDQPDFFYTDPNTDSPVIPGSSLRGMFRTLVEIAGFGKIERVSDRPRFFFRAVAAPTKTDPLAQPYKDLLKNVRAGYLVRKNDGWYIQPAKTIGRDTYLKVRAKDAQRRTSIRSFNDPNYRPQYIPVSFTYKKTPKGRTVIDKINLPSVYKESGILVSSGNMLETNKKGKSPRKKHCVVLEPSKTTQLLKLDDQAISDYRAGLTDFQKEAPFNEKWGMLEDKRPVFYCHPRRGNVIYFGQSPNFRIPYRFPNSDRAATLADFVPEKLKSPQVIDLAEAIFGYVRAEKQESEQALAGRVFVSDAKLEEGQNNIWLSNLEQPPITPKILAGPKPTTFQHYLTQDSSNKKNLNHYAKKPTQDTVIRGHKLYWHKGEVKYNDIAETDQQEIQDKKTQYTQIRPVKKGTKFEFTMRFENMSEIELGALLWVLQIAADDQYRLKLGMGKPLGMGAVQIAHEVVINHPLKRYKTFFNAHGDEWETGERPITESERDKLLKAFTNHVLKHLGVNTEFSQIPRIQSLLAMLSWPGPPRQKTRYMEIERDKHLSYIGQARRQDKTVNEYKDRPVLPRPLQVLDDPNSSHSKTSPEPTSTTPNLTVSSPAKEIKKEKVLNIPPVGHLFRGSVSDPETYKGVVIFQVPHFNVSEVIGALPIEESKRNQYPKGQPRWVSVTRIGKLNDGKKVLYLRLVPKAERKGLKKK